MERTDMWSRMTFLPGLSVFFFFGGITDDIPENAERRRRPRRNHYTFSICHEQNAHFDSKCAAHARLSPELFFLSPLLTIRSNRCSVRWKNECLKTVVQQSGSWLPRRSSNYVDWLTLTRRRIHGEMVFPF